MSKQVPCLTIIISNAYLTSLPVLKDFMLDSYEEAMAMGLLVITGKFIYYGV